jgi:purine nucleosidase
MARKVVLDMDPGVDDAIALCVALAAPELNVLAVTATGGNVTPRQATLNVQGLIENLDPPRRPRIGAAANEQSLRTDGRFLHGVDGLCGANLQVAELVNRHLSLKVLCEEIRQSPGEVTIIATGPLTNIADMLRSDPLLAEQVGHLIILGGTIGGPGNITATAEFNIYCDAESARQVFRSKMTKTLIPLDMTSQVVMGFELLETLKKCDSRTSRLLEKILPGAFRSYRQRLGIEGIYVHDVVATMLALRPEWFETERLHGDVEAAGDLTHGMTVFDRRPRSDSQPNMDVVVSIDAEEIHGEIINRLERAS